MSCAIKLSMLTKIVIRTSSSVNLKTGQGTAETFQKVGNHFLTHQTFFMKKSKLFFMVGTAVLAISAVFATKANKKFASVTVGYLKGYANAYVTLPSNILTNVNNIQTPLKTAYVSLYTSGTHALVFQTLVTSSTSTNKLWFK
jgi:hypothetical protein